MNPPRRQPSMRVENDHVEQRQAGKTVTPARFKVALFVNFLVVSYLIYLNVTHGGPYLTNPYSYELRKTVERVGCILLATVGVIVMLPVAFGGNRTERLTALALGIFPLGVAYVFWSAFISEFFLR